MCLPYVFLCILKLTGYHLIRLVKGALDRYNIYLLITTSKEDIGKSILQVPDTGTGVLDNTRPFLCSSIVNF